MISIFPGGRICGLRALCVLGLILQVNLAPAQFAPLFLNPDPDLVPTEVSQLRRLPRDPLTQASLLKAEQAISAGDITLGLETLQELLDHDADFLLVEGPRPRTSLFQEVERLLQAHRDEYERLFAPTARQILEAGRTARDTLPLEEVIRRFEITTAGAAALRELAQIERDRGDPALAARLLERLAMHPATLARRDVIIEAGKMLAASGQDALAEDLLRRRGELFSSRDELISALQSLPRGSAPAPADAPQYEWRTPYGDVDHASQTGAAPALFDDAWSANLIHEIYDFPGLLPAPDVARRLAEESRGLAAAVEQRIRSSDARLAFPAPRPLIVNDLLIVAGPGSVKAYHLPSGRLEWNGVNVDETFTYLQERSYSAGEAHDAVREEMRDLFASVRGWRDLTASSLSTDGERVYAIIDCQLVGTTSPQRMMQNTQPHPLMPQRSNQLIAFDLSRDGTLCWPSRGAAGARALPEQDAGAREIFFYGAPLPVDGRLYVIGEERGQVQLFEMDPATGAILWSIGLLNPDRDLVLDDVRRLAGLMPAYGAGLLVCPTGEGNLTAVDPVKRQVVWTHFYAELQPPVRNQVLMLRMMRPQSQTPVQSRDELLSDQRWFDSRVIIDDRYVIFTPPDDDSLVCLNIADGTPIWKERLPRMQMNYVAGTYKDQLILVGRSEINSIRLVDAQPAWKNSIPIPGPSGRGVRMGNQFLQPLRTGEIAVVDLDGGRLLTRFPMASGKVPGNLVADRGVLVSQTSTSIDAFRSREWLEQEILVRLEHPATQAAGLELRGAWELQRGELNQGLADLRQAIRGPGSSLGQQVLVWSLLDGLRTDFAAYRAQADEIERSLTGREQRLRFLRTFALGLQQAGESAAAFERYLKILEILPWPQQLTDLDSRWSATDGRWVLGRLEELLESQPPQQQTALRGVYADWVRQVPDTDLLLRVLPALPSSWVEPETVLARLAQSPWGESTWHSRDALLSPLLTSTDPAVQAQAAAQLLALGLKTKDADMALRMLSRLEARDLPLPGGPQPSTLALARSVRATPQYAKELQSVPVWPRELAVAVNQPTPTRPQLYQIPLLGPASQALAGWTFFIDQAGVNFELFDPHGRHRARIPTGLPGVRYASEADLGRYVCMHNHLAMIVMLDRFLLLDFLTDDQPPRLITNKQITGEEDNQYGRNALMMPGRQQPGIRTMLLEMRVGRPMANVGPLADSLLCYSEGRDVVAIDPVSGSELWRRRDMPAGCEIFGDERFVVIKPPDGSILQVLRANDGGQVSTCELPPNAVNYLQRRGGDWGRYFPLVEADQNGLTWKLFDPAANDVAWSQQSPAGTKWTAVNGRDVAFLTPENVLTIREGLSGRLLFEGPVPVENRAEEISVLEFPDQWILMTSNRSVDLVRRQAYGTRGHDMIMAPVNGTVAAIDRGTGQVSWTTPVENQEAVTQFPARWPVLLFGKGLGKMEALVVNRFTGAAIRRQPVPNDSSGISWSTEMQPLRIQLKFAQDKFTLSSIEDAPAPPPEEDRPAAPRQNESKPPSQ